MVVHTPGQKGSGAAHPPWRPSSAALRMLGLLLTISCVACASRETRYHVLSLFFDGVPPPYQAAATLSPEETAGGPTEVVAPLHSEHPPFAQKRCELCHNRQKANILIVEKHEICGTCHTTDMFEGAFRHGPAASSQCYACHDPHESGYPNLLFTSGSAICAKCHNPETFVEIDRHRSEQGEECLSCHMPHVADKPYLLK